MDRIRWCTCVAILGWLALPALGQRLVGKGAVTWPDERLARREAIPVAKTIWQGGGTAGDFNDANNWSNGVPTAGTTPAIADGSTQDSMTTNLDRTAGGAFELITTPAYTGNIGASGTPLQWNGPAVARGAMIRGTGTAYLEPAIGNNTDVVIDTAGGTVVLSGEMIGFLVKSGNVTCTSTATFGDVGVIDGAQAVVTIAQQAVAQNLPTTLVVNGGTVTLARDWIVAVTRSLTINGGTVTITGVIAEEVVSLINGGVVTYNPTNDPAAESPPFNVVGGVLDLSDFSGTIPAGRVIIGVNGHIIGAPGLAIHTFQDYDLRDPYPGD